MLQTVLDKKSGARVVNYATSRAKTIAAVIVLTGTMGFLLSGCTFSASIGTGPLTVKPEALASLAADALEKSVGSRPEMDCGKDIIEVKVGNKTLCTLTDPDTQEQYDTTVIISTVKGTKYTIDVKVADAPR